MSVINPDFKAAMEFDRTLSVGMPAHVRWTNNHNHYGANGTVVKVNAMSVRVAITDAIYEPKYIKGVDHADGTCTPGHFVQGDIRYPAGQEISVPRCKSGAMLRWSFNNGVFPPVTTTAMERYIDKVTK